MSITVKDSAAADQVMKTTGAGTELSPHVSHNIIDTLPGVASIAGNAPSEAILIMGIDESDGTSAAAVKATSDGELLVTINDTITVDGSVSISGDANCILGSVLPGVGIEDGGYLYATTQNHVTSADASSGVAITAAPSAGQSIEIIDLLISTDTNLKVTIREVTTGNVLTAAFLTANSGWDQLTLRSSLIAQAVDNAIEVLTSAAGNIEVTAKYRSV